ncbi:hypothetical protein CPB85DRAFT_1274107 [Mucidula mucida]|nr:hypothetical protein CPB85DRAFT_1274107 [Mucidula mucida]
MAALSLHERLCAISEPRFSATDMIKDLIECLSITLTSSSIRRNTHTLCTLSPWIEAGKLWANNRRTTIKTLTSLFETGHFKPKDLTLFRQHDDNAFLEELTQESSSRCNGQKNKTLPKLRAIRSKLQLGDKNDLTEYSVKFMLVFVGVVEVTVKTSDTTTRQHLVRMKCFLKFSLSRPFSKSIGRKIDDPKLQSQREAQWKELINALLKGRVASPSFNELKKFPAKIRPPYYLQCLVLVQYCRDLLKEHADKSPQPAVEPVQRALASVTTALQAATKLSEAAAGVKPNIEAFKTPEVDKAFTTAVKAVSDSYKEYGITFPQQLMQQAKDTDENRYVAWKDTVKKTNANTPAPTVEVVVKLSGKAAPSLKLKDETYKVSRTSSLNMILWQECQRTPPQYRERVRKARFVTPEQPTKVLSLSDSISDVLGVAATTKAKTVQLIVD